jgi:hypothetical protein
LILKKRLKKFPVADQKILQAMDKDHKGKVTLKQFLDSVQSQIVSKPTTTAASKLGIVPTPSPDSPGMKVMNILGGLYDAYEKFRSLGTRTVQSTPVPAPQTPVAPAKTTNTVAVPVVPAKPNEAPATKTDKAEAKLSELEVYGRMANKKPIVGLNWVDVKDGSPLSQMTLPNFGVNSYVKYDDSQRPDQLDVEKKAKGKKAAIDSTEVGVVRLNALYNFNKYLGVGVFYHQDPFSAGINSQYFGSTGLKFFRDNDKFDYAGATAVVSKGITRNNAIAFSFTLGTAPEPKGVSIGAQNQVGLYGEYMHKIDFSNFVMFFGAGVGASATGRKTTTAATTTSTVTSNTQKNPFLIDDTLVYPNSSSVLSFTPKMVLQGLGDRPWKMTVDGQWQQDVSGQKLDTQKYFQTRYTGMVGLEKPVFKNMGVRVLVGYGEIHNNLTTQAEYANEYIAKQNRDIIAFNRANPSNRQPLITMDPKVVSLFDNSTKIDKRKEFNRLAAFYLDYYFLEDKSLKVTLGVQIAKIGRSTQFENGYRSPDWRHPAYAENSVVGSVTMAINPNSKKSKESDLSPDS